MKRANKLTSIVGIFALVLGMSAGIASAQSVDTSDPLPMTVNVLCTMPNTVNLDGNGAFAPYDIASLGDGTTSTAANALEVEVNVGCYLGPWEVHAEITAFDGPGPLFFPGEWFSMEAGPVNAPYAPVDPEANDSEFVPAPGFSGESENAIFETYHLFTLPWWLGGAEVDAPAPFISTANYTGHLENMNSVIPGAYSADLTVELILD